MSKRQFTRHTPQAPPVPKKPAGTIPAHIEAERAALGHLLRAASERDADAMLEAMEDRFFSHLGNLELFKAIKTLRAGHRAVDVLTVTATIKDQPWFATVGGIQGLSEMDRAAEAPLFSALEILRTESDLRDSKSSAESILKLIQERRTPEEIKKGLRELADKIQTPAKGERKALVTVNPKGHLSYSPPEGLCLVGDYDVTKGYEGVMAIGGPPGSGKSLAASSLAIAGAIGSGTWMGRKVHRRFKTLIIQAENGAMRMKSEFETMMATYPRAKLEDSIRYSLPPEGGLPFHRPEFRRALTNEVREFNPDVIVIDPWTAVAADDAAKDVVDKLAEIRSCLPPGDACPAVVIVCHTRKPKSEGLRKGRALLNELSGSLALGSTARSVYVLLPFTDDMEDDRILWCCAKLSNGLAPSDTVWHRKLGQHFQPAQSDPEEFWARANGQGRKHTITEAVMAELFHGRKLARVKIVEALQELGFSRASAYEAIKLDGRFSDRLKDRGGLLEWSEEGGDEE